MVDAEITELFIGKQIENLTLLEPTDARRSGYVVWKCRCVCENVVYVSSRQLKRKTMTSCGCIPHYRQRNQNLTGKRIGHLKVDYLSEKCDSEGKKLWHLTCDCGGEVYMTTGDVNREKRQHCGCMPPAIKNLYGYKKGNLTAIRPTDRRSKSGSVIWICRCSCENMTEASENELVHGNRVSCGCRKRKAQKMIGRQKHFIEGTCIERLGQKPARSDNKSGVCGVHMICKGKYAAYIGFKGKRYYLGRYKVLTDAEQARLKAVGEMHKPLLDKYQMYLKEPRERCKGKDTHVLITR